jgi:hypothetical protein
MGLGSNPRGVASPAYLADVPSLKQQNLALN